MGSITSSMADNQRKAMDRQQKTMIAMGVANSRDLSQWIGGVLSVYTLGLLLAPKPLPKVVFGPFCVLSTVLAYNLDFAYGTKAERIRKEFYKISEHEDHWFSKPEIDEAIHKDANEWALTNLINKN